MKKIFHILFAIIFISSDVLWAEPIKPQDLLNAIDDNLWSETKYIEGRLIINNGRRIRELQVHTWMEGTDKSYSYYLSPPREKGTQMLKLFSKLWIYTPRTDRKVLIAGHLLRQSMMGSDLSYEDMMEDRKLSNSYKAQIEMTEKIDGVDSLVLFLTANDKMTTYQTRKAWTDPVKKIVYKEERYAKSGQLLKRIKYLRYHKIKNRLFPSEISFRDMLKKGTKTSYVFDRIDFDLKIPAKYFSQSILKR